MNRTTSMPNTTAKHITSTNKNMCARDSTQAMRAIVSCEKRASIAKYHPPWRRNSINLAPQKIWSVSGMTCLAAKRNTALSDIARHCKGFENHKQGPLIWIFFPHKNSPLGDHAYPSLPLHKVLYCLFIYQHPVIMWIITTNIRSSILWCRLWCQ